MKTFFTEMPWMVSATPGRNEPLQNFYLKIRRKGMTLEAKVQMGGCYET
jgi:hypothetical protein